jgi:hypothetical protein
MAKLYKIREDDDIKTGSWFQRQYDQFESHSLQNQDHYISCSLFARKNVVISFAGSVFLPVDLMDYTLRELYYLTLLAQKDMDKEISSSYTMWEANQYLSVVKVFRALINYRETAGEVMIGPPKIRSAPNECVRSLLERVMSTVKNVDTTTKIDLVNAGLKALGTNTLSKTTIYGVSYAVILCYTQLYSPFKNRIHYLSLMTLVEVFSRLFK